MTGAGQGCENERMSNDWAVAAAGFGGALIGGSVTLIGQWRESLRRSKADKEASISEALDNMVSGSVACQLQPNTNNQSILGTSLAQLMVRGEPTLREVATKWYDTFRAYREGKGTIDYRAMERELIEAAGR